MAAVAAATVEAGLPVKAEPAPARKKPMTPPTSEEADKHDGSSSELSDLELDGDDVGEIEPDHYYEGGRIPVFKPTMKQFKSFKLFVEKIDKYGMKSGIVKVIPPQEWRDSLGALDEAVKTIKVKNPISQEFHGSHGTYTQANMEKQRSYNLPQWRALCEESNHQPPAKRGERRLNQDRAGRNASAPRSTRRTSAPLPESNRRGHGRTRASLVAAQLATETIEKPIKEEPDADDADSIQEPPTPTSPSHQPELARPEPAKASAKKGARKSGGRKASPKPQGRQPKSVSQRRMRNSREQVDVVDEEAFREFDYRIQNPDEWTAERCQELETAYWKSLTFNCPMYGADMPGSLFDESVTSWNVAHLENLLDVLGQKVPGVNTTYLYLGMWKATFAWHLEDVDLYSINYIHFGAPKQWYSISQADARRFERAMRSVWSSDSKNCDQFLRHKTYLISPQILKSQFNIEVNRLVHYEGEFVITFPYGYHSGYNLGYNCAESVNFATESWLDYGKVARKCNCEADSVWVDVWDIERKLRGEPTPELYEETEEEDEEDEDEAGDLPTPPNSDGGKVKAKPAKRKREAQSKEGKPRKKILLRMRTPAREPCCLCPNDSPYEELLPTDTGKQAHRRCGEYTPETDVLVGADGRATVVGIASIDKARLHLKCMYCRSKSGALFQCQWQRCVRAYHATCAAAAGVQVDRGPVPYYADDGAEYTVEGFDFRCRFHREKRPKFDGRDACKDALEASALVRRHGACLRANDLVQWQWWGGDVCAGFVVENRASEQTVVVSMLPRGGHVEVEHSWLLVLDPANSLLPLPSEGARPLPMHLRARSHAGADSRANDLIPRPGDAFCDVSLPQKWAEFHSARPAPNPAEVPADILARPKALWHYLGATSSELRPQYTADPRRPVNDPDANFLALVKAAADAEAAAAAAAQAAATGGASVAPGGGFTGALLPRPPGPAGFGGPVPIASAPRRIATGAGTPTASSTANNPRGKAAAAAATAQSPSPSHPPRLAQHPQLFHPHLHPQAPYAAQAQATAPAPAQVQAKTKAKAPAAGGPRAPGQQQQQHLAAHPSLSHKPANLNHPPSSTTPTTTASTNSSKPYTGKYAINDDWKRIPHGVHVDSQALRNQKAFLQSVAASSSSPSQPPTQNPRPVYTTGANNGYYQPQAHPTTAAASSSTSAPQSHVVAAAPPPQPAASAAASSMGSAPNGLPSMADVRRRSSQTLHELTDFRMQYATSLNHGTPPSTGTGKPAPVANMGSSNTTATTPTSYSRPSTSQHPTPPSSSHSSAHPALRPRSDSFKALARYPYLAECAAGRPSLYQSPYAAGGGINEAWLAPAARGAGTPTGAGAGSGGGVVPVLRRRTGSLAQDFLMKRTPSQREQVRGHVRTISTDKAAQQTAEAERRARDALQLRQQRHLAAAQQAAANAVAAAANSPTGGAILQNPLFSPDAAAVAAFGGPSRTFSNSPPFADLGMYPHAHPYAPFGLADPGVATSPTAAGMYASPTSYHAPATPLQSAPAPQSSSSSRPSTARSPTAASHAPNSAGSTVSPGHHRHSGSSGGLNFSTPADFQLQMQREAAAQQQPPGPVGGGGSGGVVAGPAPKPAPGFLTHDHTSYHAFVRGLQAGHGLHHPHASPARGHSSGGSGVAGLEAHADLMDGVDGPGAIGAGVGGAGGGGGAGSGGSPLRRGLRAAGGEMLPMMQDPPF